MNDTSQHRSDGYLKEEYRTEVIPRQLKESLVATPIAALTIGQIAPVFADTTNILPDMGMSAGSTLSIRQEAQTGDYYVRQPRGSAPLINDPLLIRYINALGMRPVPHADSIKTLLTFFLISSDKINAFTFFGDNVVLHSALLRYSDNRSQLASVMACEIFYVMQRRPARAMEDQKRSASLMWVGALGLTLSVVASLQANTAALTDMLAGIRQGMISFTQQNEQEADRINIQVLQRSGFDPQAMPTFLEKLPDQTRYSSHSPEILLVHPLLKSRLSDARNRANQMRSMVAQSSEDFYLAKARTLGMYNSGRNQLINDLLSSWSKGSVREQRIAQCGRALQVVEVSKYDETHKAPQPLLAADPSNARYLDPATDIDLGQKKASDAVNRLENVHDLRTNPVLQLNLANTYLQGGQTKEATTILNRCTFNHKDNPSGWGLLAQTEANLSNRDQELAVRAEGHAFAGCPDQVISILSSTSLQAKLDSRQQARYDARIGQLCQLQERFKPYTKT